MPQTGGTILVSPAGQVIAEFSVGPNDGSGSGAQKKAAPRFRPVIRAIVRSACGKTWGAVAGNCFSAPGLSPILRRFSSGMSTLLRRTGKRVRRRCISRPACWIRLRQRLFRILVSRRMFARLAKENPESGRMPGTEDLGKSQRVKSQSSNLQATSALDMVGQLSSRPA